ncbi:phosphatidylserine/phosphatidylglycerophosphate/cardiolipin synthase-like enzyme [Nocardioides sp. BE266]|uniref:phospholipase D-like domain-containing protein n=1 Tax=Nocardioides sp. BE266 TaxID=2817725 RepID=UPI00285AF4AC|nr:phospholipase D-like domain-containing protein [Nocardioides sp. BE266]MDR7252518.1 phosphatidylserine/phosphatidylglycerophosphate/cardiolipin synthase-like enzyme [Nocardioides sp. BE266]
MTIFASGKIEAYVGPTELGAADDLETVISDFIAGARTSLAVAVQELDNAVIAQALLDASWRGVRVELFLEQDYLRSPLAGTPPTLPVPKAGETPEDALLRVQWGTDETELAENRRILAALLRSDVQVRGDYNPKIFHQKFALRDYEGTAVPTSALLSGSANFTVTDCHHNLNHVFVFRNAFVCRQYATEVEQLRRGSFGRGMHGDVPKTYDLAGVPVKVLFGPDHTPELEIMKQMLKGTKEITFAIFTFAGSSGIDDAMLALARGGMKIRGVLDRGQAAHDWAAPPWLVHPNIELFVPRKDGPFEHLRKLHHKLMVIDEQVVVAGSFNYTAPANEYNDENIFVVGSVHDEVEGIEVDHDPGGVIARHLKAEIERIIDNSDVWTPGP